MVRIQVDLNNMLGSGIVVAATGGGQYAAGDRLTIYDDDTDDLDATVVQVDGDTMVLRLVGSSSLPQRYPTFDHDYNWSGYNRRIILRLSARERAQITVGALVTILGDTVPTMDGIVVEIDEPEAVVMLDPQTQRGEWVTTGDDFLRWGVGPWRGQPNVRRRTITREEVLAEIADLEERFPGLTAVNVGTYFDDADGVVAANLVATQMRAVQLYDLVGHSRPAASAQSKHGTPIPEAE